MIRISTESEPISEKARLELAALVEKHDAAERRAIVIERVILGAFALALAIWIAS